MKTKIYKCTRKVKYGFQGFIKVFDNKNYLWSQSSEIIRMNKADARLDAINLYLDYCIKNNNSLTI
jgi:hypothetical protein